MMCAGWDVFVGWVLLVFVLFSVIRYILYTPFLMLCMLISMLDRLYGPQGVVFSSFWSCSIVWGVTR